MLFYGAYWVTTQLAAYEEFGDYLLRLGLSWLFLTFLAFLAFSGVVTSLSTFFLSDDLRLLHEPSCGARFFPRASRAPWGRRHGWSSSSWRPCSSALAWDDARGFYATTIATVLPFSIIPVALGSACTLFVVNVFPARRARSAHADGARFAAAVVLLLRFIQPERLLRVESLPDITDFFATLQSPITPMLPSFWRGNALRGRAGRFRLAASAALWTTAGALTVLLGAAHARWHFAGYSRSQEAPKTRFARFRTLDLAASMLPLSPVRRQLLVKDVKIFLRDVSHGCSCSHCWRSCCCISTTSACSISIASRT